MVSHERLGADYLRRARFRERMATEMADVVEKRRQHHFIIEAFGHRPLCGLGHVLDLRHRLADVILRAVPLIQAEDLGNRLFRAHHAVPHNRLMLRSASAGPTLMPTPVCINAAFTPGAARRNENGPGPREPYTPCQRSTTC